MAAAASRARRAAPAAEASPRLQRQRHRGHRSRSRLWWSTALRVTNGTPAIDAPAGHTIASVTLSDWFTRANTNGPYSFLASSYGLLEGCFNGTVVCGSVMPRHTLAVNGAGEVRSEVGCASVSCTDATGVGT